MQIEIYDQLYLSEGMKKKRKKVVQQILHYEFRHGTFLLTLPGGNQNQLEFFDAAQLKQKVFQDAAFFVVGIADGYEEALYLVEQIIQEVYQNTEDLSVRNYILQHQL